MAQVAHPGEGLIGPNAILQLLPVLDQFGEREKVLKAAGITKIPDGRSMIPEADAARVHKVLREVDPEHAPEIARAAGIKTADYILAHRIPPKAQWFLQVLPKRMAARVLSQAIAKHAWTFVGSGQFRVVDPWTFEITHNPLIRGEHSDDRLCFWHAAVFERLYQELVAPGCSCEEVECGAQTGEGVCRFWVRG